MLEKIFKKPVELKIGDQILKFNTVTDVAFCLEGRTSVSSKRLSELFELSAAELETQAVKLASLNKSMFQVLNSIVDEPDNIDRSMRELDTQMFSQDQSWRDIIQSLNKEQGEINAIRVTVIMKYMKYLSALEETIGYIRAGMKKNATATAFEDIDKATDFGATWSLSHLREEVALASEAKKEFRRLPKDKPVSVNLTAGNRFDILLASYPCQIVAENAAVQFINNNGTTILHKGSNIVGRSAGSTVKIDAAERQVSRKHLSVVINGSNAVQLTDHSTEGTFVNIDFV
jgi:hypothetical protein